MTVTEMFEAAQNEDWEAVASRLETHPQEAKTLFHQDTVLHEAASHGAPMELLEKLIDAFPEALVVPGNCFDMPPLVYAIEEAVALPKIRLLLERGPEALKMELGCGHGLAIHRIWYAAMPRKDDSIEEWQEWKAMIKFALDYYPEATTRPLDNGEDETLIELILRASDTENQGPITSQVTQMVFDAAYQCLIKSRHNGELPSDYKYLPIHAAIELLHDNNYAVMDRFCRVQFAPRDEKTKNFIRELKRCIYNDEEALYWEYWKRSGGIMKFSFERNYRMGRFSFVEKMIQTYPDQLFRRDDRGRLPLELCCNLLNQEFEFGYSSQSPQVQISKLIRDKMSRMARELIFETYGVHPAFVTF